MVYLKAFVKMKISFFFSFFQNLLLIASSNELGSRRGLSPLVMFSFSIPLKTH